MDLKLLKVVSSASSSAPPKSSQLNQKIRASTGSTAAKEEAKQQQPSEEEGAGPGEAALLLEEKASSGNINPGGGVPSLAVPGLFSPYSATVPWHRGVRAFLSGLFPKYGHYCGPNWSSGRSRGSLVWERPPIDWLDYCCFCHDVGYDSHDQAQLYKADLALLDCLQNQMPPTGWSHPASDARFAEAYRNACIAGLKNFILPYRKMLLANKNLRF